jgi:hypothetical protein
LRISDLNRAGVVRCAYGTFEVGAIAAHQLAYLGADGRFLLADFAANASLRAAKNPPRLSTPLNLSLTHAFEIPSDLIQRRDSGGEYPVKMRLIN